MYNKNVVHFYRSAGNCRIIAGKLNTLQTTGPNIHNFASQTAAKTSLAAGMNGILTPHILSLRLHRDITVNCLSCGLERGANTLVRHQTATLKLCLSVVLLSCMCCFDYTLTITGEKLIRSTVCSLKDAAADQI